GEDKGFLRRVADKLNPFSSSGSTNQEEKSTETLTETLAKRGQAQKEAQKNATSNASTRDGNNANTVVTQIDDSLKQKGIDPSPAEAGLNPPPADLPNTDDMAQPPAKPTDTAALLSSVDSNLKRSGKDSTELPPAPEAAEGFKNAAAAQAIVAKTPQPQEPPKDVQSSGILSSIDQKLAAKGVQAAEFEKPPTAEEVKTATVEKSRAGNNLELEPKLSIEKGPLFLNPADVETGEKPAAIQQTKQPETASATPELSSRVLVKGPIRTEANSNASETTAK